MGLKIIIIFLLNIGATVSSQKGCPFNQFYQFGDGYADIGNSIRILPDGPQLPAARSPYGITFPGTPTGRWGDGGIDADYAASGVGLPNLKPYLSLNATSSSSGDGISFGVAETPVLDRQFFTDRNINNIPSYATSISSQVDFFTTYLNSSPSASAGVGNSVALFSFAQAKDEAYALLSGKSIHQVKTYLPVIIEAQINAARRLIALGVSRVVISATGPLGCYPYILTALPSSNPLAYDALGCLAKVNALIVSKNIALQLAITALQLEFANVTILFADDYTASTITITQMLISGGRNIGLRSCCGVGGRYNYSSSMFCGSPGVPVCSNPNEYIYWDGKHYTQQVYRRNVAILIGPARLALGCTIL